MDALNKIVSAYLDIAEVHALNQEPMYMKDWLQTIDDYLKMTRRDVLTDAGKISHKLVVEKAHNEYDQFVKKDSLKLSKIEKDYFKIIESLNENLSKK